MGKTGRFRMNMKNVFLAAVGIAVIGLIVAAMLIARARLFVLAVQDGISLYNLLVDIVVGVFTVWGLYWAASELALKPELNLVIGEQSSGEPLTSEADALIGQQGSFWVPGRPQVHVALFLENTQPKAARYVRVVLRVRDVPRPEPWKSVLFPHSETVYARPQGEAMVFQFGEGLVVYKGAEKVHCSNVLVAWPQGTHPEKITFVAELYSLEGEPKEVTVSHPIHWD